MKKWLSLVLLPALLVGSLIPARAQTSEGPPSKKGDAERAAARAELERKALGLLGEALAAARQLKLAENRVHAQITAARLLWPRDAAAGREAFKAAADGVAELSAAVDPEDQQFYGAAQTVMQLRGELLQIATQFDAKLALEFLRATRPPYADALAAAGYGQQEQMFETNLASRIAAQEPRRAFEMAQESLSRGVTTGLLNVLNELRTKEPASAARLAADIVRRLRAEDMLNNYEASGVAQQLLALTRPADAAQGNAPGQAVIYVGGTPVAPGAGVGLLDEPTRRELVEKILAAAASSAPNQNGSYNLFQALQTLMPEVERYAPGRAAALRRRADELERGFNPQGRLMRPFEELMRTGTVEALLEAAPKAPAEVRDHLYMHAAWKSFNEGKDPERARRILESISNPQQRAQTRRSMEMQAQMNAAAQGGYAEVRQSAARLTSIDERVALLMQIAAQAAGAGDKQTARQVLEDVLALAETQTRGHQQFNHRLQVAAAYTRFDPNAAFEVVETSIARLDELLDAAVVLDGFGQDAFREGELKPQGGYLWHDLINRCAMALAALAPSDFERASADAAKFRRVDARTTAQLALAAHILNATAPVQGRRYDRMVPLVGYGRGK
ncbi:MAG TPA: hypothetical protein VFZ44_07790 [Pyrinomonadaceae bacterium]